MKVQFKADAYLATSYQTLNRVISGETLPVITAQGDGGYYEKEGYPKIGECVVTVELFSESEIVQRQIQALQAELEKERAAAQVKENAILLKISKLQALTCEAQPA